MDVLHTGHWLGKSISFLPKDTLNILGKYFSIQESGHDVSILSEREIEFCFFYYDPIQTQSLLITSIKMCQNLDKKLILIHDDKIDTNFLDLDVILDSYNIQNSNIESWIETLSKNIHYLFSRHQEVIHLHRNKKHFEENKISKDLAEILRYIDSHISETIREEDIADYCHYSVTYFSRLFHQSIGMSFRDYLTSKRISLAKHLLVSERDSKIASIAYQCGYKDVSYFSRIFKKKTGITPASFRQIH